MTRTRARWKIAVAVAVSVSVLACSDGGGGAAPREPTRQETAAYQKKVFAAFKEMTDGLREVIPAVQEWRDGRKPAPDLTSQLSGVAASFAATPAKTAAMPRFEPEPRAKGMYVASAYLLDEFLHLAQEAVQTADVPLQQQVELLARRVRVLGDRVFDRGQGMIDPSTYATDASSTVEVRHVAEVPDWAAEGMAAGPPLDDPPPPAADPPPGREEFRPQQEEAKWRKAIARLQVPSARGLAAAVDSGDQAGLRTAAHNLEDASARLGPVADPPGGRDRAAAVRLGLLAQAEAARASQVASLVHDPAATKRLRAIARRLILVGDSLWDKALPERSSGLDPGLLSAQ